MSRYKIGDKVRVLHTDFPNHIKQGEVREVSKVDDAGIYISIPEGDCYFYNSEVEPYTEPTTRTDTLTLTAALDATNIHTELDAIIAKLERIRELRAELGLVNFSTGAQHD